MEEEEYEHLEEIKKTYYINDKDICDIMEEFSLLDNWINDKDGYIFPNKAIESLQNIKNMLNELESKINDIKKEYDDTFEERINRILKENEEER